MSDNVHKPLLCRKRKYSLSSQNSPWMSSGHPQIISPLSDTPSHVLLFWHWSHKSKTVQDSAHILWEKQRGICWRKCHLLKYLLQAMWISYCSFLHLPVSQFSPVVVSVQVQTYVILPDSSVISQVPLFIQGDGLQGSRIKIQSGGCSERRER